MSILVLGTVALDTVRTPYGERKKILGGSASHFAMSARLFSRVNIVSVVGSDFPQRHLDFLRGKNISLASLSRSPEKTFAWEGEYRGDLDTARTLRTELGALVTFKPQVFARERGASHVFLANIDPDLQQAVLRQLRRPALIAMDSMDYWIRHKRASLLRLMKRVDIFMANDQEARSLTGEDSLVAAARGLRALGPKLILVKKGQHGSLMYGGSFFIVLPAYPVAAVIDPTGAGDTFAGGFMGYLAQAGSCGGGALKKALVWGTVAASFNVEGFGLERTATLTKKALQARATAFRRQVSF